jgi:hypothetical protein
MHSYQDSGESIIFLEKQIDYLKYLLLGITKVMDNPIFNYQAKLNAYDVYSPLIAEQLFKITLQIEKLKKQHTKET